MNGYLAYAEVLGDHHPGNPPAELESALVGMPRAWKVVRIQ